jgi:hypothetical protein
MKVKDIKLIDKIEFHNCFSVEHESI